MMLPRYLSVVVTTANFTNANNNGNLNNNNASNANGVVPDFKTLVQHIDICDQNVVSGKEIGSCSKCSKNSLDVCHLTGESNYMQDLFNNIIDPLTLLLSYYETRKGVTWKNSVQRYEYNLLRNINNDHKRLLNGEVPTKGFNEFYLRERGKIRYIRAVHISERVIQKAICKVALIPLLTPYLIYDNGASIKGKGLTFTRNRLKAHLRRHGSEGYVILIDCRKYFDSISHEILFDMLDDVIKDEKTLYLIKQYIKMFGKQGLGLGSEISQICAIFYPHRIDRYIKEELKVKGYGRYMDDSYVLCRTKEEAHYLLDCIKSKYEEFELTVNDRKTKIVKLTRGFNFTKIRYTVTDTGKIITRPNKDSRVRMGRKLKKFKKMDFNDDEILNAYKIWRGYWVSINGNPLHTDKLLGELL